MLADFVNSLLDIAAMIRFCPSLSHGLAGVRTLYGPAFQLSESLKAFEYFEGGDLHRLTQEERTLLIEVARVGAVDGRHPRTCPDCLRYRVRPPHLLPGIIDCAKAFINDAGRPGVWDNDRDDSPWVICHVAIEGMVEVVWAAKPTQQNTQHWIFRLVAPVSRPCNYLLVQADSYPCRRRVLHLRTRLHLAGQHQDLFLRKS
jgi:hypothetical protein